MFVPSLPHVTLEQPAGARLVTASGRGRSIPLTLRYAAGDPLAVHIDFPAHVTADGEVTSWTFARGLLAEGLVAPAGPGAVRVRPYGTDGTDGTLVELRTAHGTAALRFDTAVLHRFLLRTYSVVAPEEETVDAVLDDGVAELYGRRAS
ncbi:SsgA family sporulation/cell division regulator [Streptomyces sp. NBC_00820]|uniref:SsgA family sporulation/cell division regulator n=1 Tax=Streptomyces sp. NBC_00820 TaxID=2975842 RepID=UPI002ED19653|nr:SsgA family sporulation/cell division regulator [Streptomyces sp. NBC_00820]